MESSHLPQPQPTFRLLDLPPELRERVYYHCLVVPVALIILKPISPFITGPKSFKLTYTTDETIPKPKYTLQKAHPTADTTPQPQPPPPLPSINFNLLLVNKAIHAETLPILYHQNIPKFSPWGPQSPWPALARFTTHIPTHNLSLVRTLSIQFRPPDSSRHSFIFIFTTDSDHLLRLPSLRCLHLAVCANLAGRDLAGLGKIRDAQRWGGGRWRVRFRVGGLREGRGGDALVERVVVDTFREWGWELTGEFEVEEAKEEL